ncbi:uncharacterized protein LOC144651886 isoform X2 [Oculina patagonica]
MLNQTFLSPSSPVQRLLSADFQTRKFTREYKDYCLQISRDASLQERLSGNSFWQISTSRLLGNSFWQISTSRLSGNSFWQISTSRLLGNSFWQISTSRLSSNSFWQISTSRLLEIVNHFVNW